MLRTEEMVAKIQDKARERGIVHISIMEKESGKE